MTDTTQEEQKHVVVEYLKNEYRLVTHDIVVPLGVSKASQPTNYGK